VIPPSLEHGRININEKNGLYGRWIKLTNDVDHRMSRFLRGNTTTHTSPLPTRAIDTDPYASTTSKTARVAKSTLVAGMRMGDSAMVGE